MRNFRPLTSSIVRISRRNQPPICVPVLPDRMNVMPRGRSQALNKSLPPPSNHQALCERKFRPNGIAPPKAQVGSWPTYQPEKTCAQSMVPAATASAACGIGTISPGGATVIWKRPPVMSPMRLAAAWVVPKTVSRDAGKPDMPRQRTAGAADWAMAGAATSAAPTPAPTPARDRNERRSMSVSRVTDEGDSPTRTAAAVCAATDAEQSGLPRGQCIRHLAL